MLAAKVLGDGNAVEILADLTVLDDGTHVEEEDEPGEEEQGHHHAHPHQHNLPPPAVHPKRDKWQHGVGQEEAVDEAEEVGIVVNPGQESGQEENGRHPDQLEDGHLGVLEAGPLVDDLDNGGGQEAEGGAGRAHFGPVGHEDGGGEVADHAGGQVDQAGPLGAGQLLQVAHQPVLEEQRDGQVEDSEKRKS